jgi:hypothetical protein
MPLTRRHATAFLDPSGSHAVEELRGAWDPEMARQIAAHIMLIYPGEITDPAELAAAVLPDGQAISSPSRPSQIHPAAPRRRPCPRPEVPRSPGRITLSPAVTADPPASLYS